MVSYLDEKAMNVAQELSDRELYNYDALVWLFKRPIRPGVSCFGIEITISWPDTTPSGRRRYIRGRHNRTVQAGLSTELARASPGTYQ